MGNAFDTLALSKQLADGGFSEQQADTLSNAMLQFYTDNQLVTKSDLAAAIEGVDRRLEKMSLDFDRKLEKLRAEIIQWMFGVMIVQSGVTALLFRLMH